MCEHCIIKYGWSRMFVVNCSYSYNELRCMECSDLVLGNKGTVRRRHHTAPLHIRNSLSICCFHHQLKTFFHNRAFRLS